MPVGAFLSCQLEQIYNASTPKAPRVHVALSGWRRGEICHVSYRAITKRDQPWLPSVNSTFRR